MAGGKGKGKGKKLPRGGPMLMIMLPGALPKSPRGRKPRLPKAPPKAN